MKIHMNVHEVIEGFFETKLDPQAVMQSYYAHAAIVENTEPTVANEVCHKILDMISGSEYGVGDFAIGMVMALTALTEVESNDIPEEQLDAVKRTAMRLALARILVGYGETPYEAKNETSNEEVTG